MTGYTKVDNWLFDEVMPKAKPNTYKIVSAVMRCTSGWKKNCDKISMSQFHSLTGISSRSTLADAIQDALDEGFIERQAVGNSYTYQLKIGTETVPIENDNRYGNRTDTGTETVPKIGTETVHTKGKGKETIKRADDYDAVIKVYEQEIGMITKMMDIEIGKAASEFGSNSIIEAIEIAAKNNVRKWSYVEGILERWRVNGKHKQKAAVEKVGRPEGGGLYV